MPLILGSHEINTWISDITERSEKHLVIICPYLKINDRLRRSIELADSHGILIYVLYGKEKLDPETMSWLKRLKHSNIAFLQNLHAKLYMNDDYALMSSMNLYEYSQINNEELGSVFSRREDRREFKDVLSQALRLIDYSVKEYGSWELGDLDKPLKGVFSQFKKTECIEESPGEQVTDVPEPVANIDNSVPGEPVTKGIRCHCIRCGHIIPSEYDYVYCGRCMEPWKKYSNMRYAEKQGHCYVCGNSYEATAERPACRGCYSVNADLVKIKLDRMRSFGPNKQ